MTTDADEPVRYRGTDGQYLRGVPAALIMLAVFLGAASVALTGWVFRAAALVIVVVVGALWWKVLAPRTWVEVRGTHYRWNDADGEEHDLDLCEATSIEWHLIPFDGVRLRILSRRGVLLDLPVSWSGRRELHAIGQALAAAHPGRVYPDRRAAKALGLV